MSSLIEKMRQSLANGINTAIGLIKYATGFADNTKVDEATQAIRIGTCEGCPRFIALTRQCGVCLCFVDIKAPLMYDPVESQKKGEKVKTACPQGYW